MNEGHEGRQIFIDFWDAVRLGFGFSLGVLVTEILVAFFAGVIFGIVWGLTS